jgi:hypothetical protein
MKRGDEAAFPITATPDLHTHKLLGPVAFGLTKREWFVGMALQGLLAQEGALTTDVGLLVSQAMVVVDALLQDSWS